MPNNTSKLRKEVKKPRLTLSELASYDDICTDGLVDKVCPRRKALAGR